MNWLQFQKTKGRLNELVTQYGYLVDELNTAPLSAEAQHDQDAAFNHLLRLQSHLGRIPAENFRDGVTIGGVFMRFDT